MPCSSICGEPASLSVKVSRYWPGRGTGRGSLSVDAGRGRAAGKALAVAGGLLAVQALRTAHEQRGQQQETAGRGTESELDFLGLLSLPVNRLWKVEARPCMEIWKMRPMLRSTLSLSRDSPQPSQESAREYSTMVSTSCSAMVRFFKSHAQDRTFRGDYGGGQFGADTGQGEGQSHQAERFDIHRLVEADAGAAGGHVDGLAGHQAAVGQPGHDGRHDVDAHGGAQLLHLARHGGADAQDDDVEEAPDARS